MHLQAGDTRRHHPFGRAANWLVLAGTTLALTQSAIVVFGAVLAPTGPGFELAGAALGVWLLLGVGLPTVVGWLAWRALRSWWRRSVSVVGRILLAAVVAVPSTVLLRVPLGDEVLVPVGYLPAGLMMTAGGLLARRRVAAAQREGRGGLAA